MTSLTKTRVAHEPDTIKIHDTNNEPLRIIGSTILYVHAAGMMELEILLLCSRMAEPAILRWDFCVQFVESIYPKTRLVEPIDASEIFIVRQYGKL